MASTAAAATSAPRIACLIPSATAICLALGLHDQIVGITHECVATLTATATAAPLPHARILTRDGLAAAKEKQQEIQHQSQRQIHLQVQQQQQSQQCSVASNTNANDLPASLYLIVPEEFHAAQPDIVLTQDLCHVCAPSKAQVQSLLVKHENENDSIVTEIQIISLTPHTLQDVLDSIVTVADACGVAERGRQLRDSLQQQLQHIQSAVNGLQSSQEQQRKPKNVLLLEWLDPPFDGGHWILDMMECAACVNVLKPATTITATMKSTCRTWSEIQKCHADILWIASCGRTLQQNIQDCYAMTAELLRASTGGADTTNGAAQIIALDGDAHFARPGPNVVLGVAIMAWTAYQDEPAVLRALADLFPELADNPTKYFQVLDPSTLREAAAKKGKSTTCSIPENDIMISHSAPDVEDCRPNCSISTPWDRLHEEACEAGLMSYTDPDTGYSVFTALAHQKRGRCCGSGCRHCPFSHQNVKDKASRIQQPAFLYTGHDIDNDEHAIRQVFDPLHRTKSVKVLFFSGGKDSFLTIRSLVRQQRQQQQKQQQREERYALVLLTTFDATSRIIAHQEVDIKSVLRQAKHLGLPLVGVPQHRGTSMSYVARIQQGLKVIEKYLQKHGNDNATITSLIFGDLHLEHIRDWRQDQLGPLGYELLFPLWHIDYRQLEQDLIASCVPCVVSNSTIDTVKSGEMYDSTLRQQLKDSNNKGIRDGNASLDLFGEKGEFHTLVRVWEVDPSVALGL